LTKRAGKLYQSHRREVINSFPALAPTLKGAKIWEFFKDTSK
jgi:hypothetical protein